MVNLHLKAGRFNLEDLKIDPNRFDIDPRKILGDIKFENLKIKQSRYLADNQLNTQDTSLFNFIPIQLSGFNFQLKNVNYFYTFDKLVKKSLSLNKY